MTTFVLLGLAGVSLVISTSSFLRTTRVWLSGFLYKYNPLRFVAALVSSPMASGLAVGLVVGLAFYSCIEAIVGGGVVALISWVFSCIYKVVDVQIGKLQGRYIEPTREQIVSEVKRVFYEEAGQ